MAQRPVLMIVVWGISVVNQLTGSALAAVLSNMVSALEGFHPPSLALVA